MNKLNPLTLFLIYIRIILTCVLHRLTFSYILLYIWKKNKIRDFTRDGGSINYGHWIRKFGHRNKCCNITAYCIFYFVLPQLNNCSNANPGPFSRFYNQKNICTKTHILIVYIYLEYRNKGKNIYIQND
jgi:hypothetical protein